MCLSVPGKILKIGENGVCLVGYGEEVRKAKVLDDLIGVGDFVIVAGGVVVERVERERAKKFLEILKNGEN